jgi:hypothetical protein
MGRPTTVRVSEQEKELLEEVRNTEFGSNSVPLGEALEVACKNYLGEMRMEAADLNE